jgi:hypothetical protein
VRWSSAPGTEPHGQHALPVIPDRLPQVIVHGVFRPGCSLILQRRGMPRQLDDRGNSTKTLLKSNFHHRIARLKFLSDQAVVLGCMNATHAIERGAGIGHGSALDSFLLVPCRGPLEAQLEELKERLVQGFMDNVANLALARDLKWAANEAAALAWSTACPILILPTLLEEKIRATFAKWEKQEGIRRR